MQWLLHDHTPKSEVHDVVCMTTLLHSTVDPPSTTYRKKTLTRRGWVGIVWIGPFVQELYQTLSFSWKVLCTLLC